MTKNQDFKRLVRARMAKTGESYTAARLQLARRDQAPTQDEYADLAGMTDAAVQAKTGKSWAEWALALDSIGAQAHNHSEIVKMLDKEWPAVGAWWRQTVTVGYERIRGLRERGQLCNGAFAASKSKTFPVTLSVLYRAFSDDVRDGWMGSPTVVRTATENRSMRLTWPDGTVVAAWFTDKGAKSSVAIQHDKLESAERRAREKEAWGERFSVLAALLKQ